MKSRKGLLWVVGVLLLGMVSEASATVSPWNSLGTGSWRWEGVGAQIVGDMNLLDTYSTANSFSMASVDGLSSLTLISSNQVWGYVNVLPALGGQSYSASGMTLLNGSITPTAPISLGSSPEWNFVFSNGSTDFSTYELSRLGSSGAYRLDNADTGMSISFQTAGATPHATPIPGAALLLGSGLMGLLGVGSRKNKANLA